MIRWTIRSFKELYLSLCLMLLVSWCDSSCNLSLHQGHMSRCAVFSLVQDDTWAAFSLFINIVILALLTYLIIAVRNKQFSAWVLLHFYLLIWYNINDRLFGQPPLVFIFLITMRKQLAVKYIQIRRCLLLHEQTCVYHCFVIGGMIVMNSKLSFWTFLAQRFIVFVVSVHQGLHVQIIVIGIALACAIILIYLLVHIHVFTSTRDRLDLSLWRRRRSHHVIAYVVFFVLRRVFC